MVIWSIEIKKETKNVMLWFLKRHMKEQKYIAPMGFAEYLRISGVSENSKVC